MDGLHILYTNAIVSSCQDSRFQKQYTKKKLEGMLVERSRDVFRANQKHPSVVLFTEVSENFLIFLDTLREFNLGLNGALTDWLARIIHQYSFLSRSILRRTITVCSGYQVNSLSDVSGYVHMLDDMFAKKRGHMLHC